MNAAVSQIALRSGYRLVSPFCAGRTADEQAAVLVVADGEEEAREGGEKRKGKKGRREGDSKGSLVCL